MTLQVTRSIAGGGVVVTVLGVAYGIAAIAGWSPSWSSVAQAVLHLGELAVVVALVGVGAIGTRRAGHVGLGIAVLGQALLVAAELVYPSSPDVGNTLFGLGPLLSGLGMILAGVAVARAQVWHGWRRLLPLLIGIWILVPTTPILIFTGGPPAPASLIAIVVWDVLWAVCGLLALQSTAPTPATAGVTARTT
ncbi:hypothetical protein [Actinomycetospora flava]|uniref:Uncharacterized protein n=1 Tax=Actinomycetospora flava TaxID=3129232 RepID=A0ABU8M5C3_9PSEU